MKARDGSVIWIALIFVIAATAAAAWLGLRNSSPAPASAAAAAADPAPAQQARVNNVAPKRPSPPRRQIVASSTHHQPAIETSSSEAVADAPSEAPAPVVNAAETPASPAEPLPDPVQPVLAAAAPEDDFIYSNEGTGVIAPRLVSLGFPELVARGLDTRTSALELIVSKSGTVELAKISPPSRNWQDAMLLSRAKSFQFVPAQRDGHPVRYRLVMRVDATP